MASSAQRKPALTSISRPVRPCAVRQSSSLGLFWAHLSGWLQVASLQLEVDSTRCNTTHGIKYRTSTVMQGSSDLRSCKQGCGEKNIITQAHLFPPTCILWARVVSQILALAMSRTESWIFLAEKATVPAPVC